MLAESLGGTMGMVKPFFFLHLTLFKPMISISIAFGVNSKGYGFNSASLGDRNHSFKKA